MDHRAVEKSVCTTSTVPFCGGILPDLTSDEFNCKHLRVVYVTDESKYLKGEKTEDKSEKKKEGGREGGEGGGGNLLITRLKRFHPSC